MDLAARKVNERRRFSPALLAALALFAAPLVIAPSAAASTQGIVSGSVFNDMNGNGVRDVSDAGIDARTVYVDINNDSDQDGGEPFTTTVADGTYSISAVEAGAYPVREVLPAGWITTTTIPMTT